MNHLKLPSIYYSPVYLALLIGPFNVMAQWDLAQSPPGTVEPYVAPNVILSLDDSPSMNNIAKSLKGIKREILKTALKEVFGDHTLLPDGKIRLAWQGLNMFERKGIGCTNRSGLKLGELYVTSKRTDNQIAILEGNHRSNFLKYVDNFKTCGLTPTPYAAYMVDQYMRAPLHKNGPWADIPGKKLADKKNNDKPLGCRRNYHIILTDGDWIKHDKKWNTHPVNYSYQDIILPNGVIYDTQSPQTRIYRSNEDFRKNNSSYKNDFSVVADWALKSWAEPLQPEKLLQGMVSPPSEYENAAPTEIIKNRETNSIATLDKFWNPKYDPANWAHLTTFTIGFGSEALPQFNFPPNCTKKNCAKALLKPSSSIPYGDDGNLADYANGTYAWRIKGEKIWGPIHADRNQDMWRTALAGRGKFYEVLQPTDLKEAFKSIVQTIHIENTPVRSATAASGSNASRNDVGIYSASYDARAHWKGDVSAEIFTADGKSIPTPGWNNQGTAEKLDAMNPNARVIVSAQRTGSSATDASIQAIAFRWNQFSQKDEKEALLSVSAETGPGGAIGSNGNLRINYLRGDRTYEGKPFRQRSSIQGDIVNSSVWYTAAPSTRAHLTLPGYPAFVRQQAGREAMLYVGGNDGMLHGFSAANGSERIAYVPNGIIRNGLVYLSNQRFEEHHRYFVDGSPMTGDIQDGNQWKTMLLGTLGAGGRGYFVLDVTNPNHFSENQAAKIVVKDLTLANTGSKQEPAHGWLGHIFSTPVRDDEDAQRTVQITRLNNGRWAALLGNGYNSPQGQAALLIQYLNGDKALKILPATVATAATPGNGLSAPRPFDINGDGIPDVVYAGDLQGNLWKFLINGKNDSTWGVAQWSNRSGNAAEPLFKAERGVQHSSNTGHSTEQSITAAPSVKIADRSRQVSVKGQTTNLPVGGVMVAFGTGRNITVQDPGEVQQQTLYSVLDNTRYRLEMAGSQPTGRVEVCSDAQGTCSELVKTDADLPRKVWHSELVQRSIPDAASHTRGSKKFWSVNASDTLDWNTHKGWYLDLPMTRERLLQHMQLYDGSNLLMVTTQIPARGSQVHTEGESCEGSGTVEKAKQYITFINIQDGLPPQTPILDADKGLANTATAGGDMLIDGLARFETPPGPVNIIRKHHSIHLRMKNSKGEWEEEKLRPLPEVALRPSWWLLQ